MQLSEMNEIGRVKKAAYSTFGEDEDYLDEPLTIKSEQLEKCILAIRLKMKVLTPIFLMVLFLQI